MKDQNEKCAIRTPEMEQDEGTSDDVRGRSRGRRRTAKEIAQMFEQLKLRHLQKKKDWQLEREELQKQASLADESKKILVDLKKILQELRIELREEEEKRSVAEEQHHEDQTTWEREKNELLQIIKNMETKRGLANSDTDARSKMENHSLKSKVIARERELAECKILASELHNKLDENENRFKEERGNILFLHEGEKRNWEKTRQVMLDKIESLREECDRRSSTTFPLHGCHVISSPVTDDQSPTTSLPNSRNQDPMLPEKRAGNMAERRVKQGILENPSPAKYNHFQKTVDEALKQIEKISHDLNSIDVENDGKGRVKKVRRLSIDPTTAKSPFLESPSLDRISGNSRRPSFTSSITRRSITPRRKTSITSLEGEEPRRSRNTASVLSPSSSKSHITKSILQQVNSPIRQSHSNSPVAYVSRSSTRDSECVFESSDKQTPDNPDESAKKLDDSKTSTKNDNTSFSKVEKSYSSVKKNKQAEKELPKATSKLPNLHQQLLFRNSGIFSQSPTTKDHDATTTEYKSQLIDTNKDKVAPNLHTPYFNPERGYTKHSTKSPRLSRTAKFDTLNKCSFQDKNSHALSKDFLAGPIQADVEGKEESNTEADPPPVRPKPTITIEKDVRGNVLRVISDPRYQTSPAISPAPTSNNHQITENSNTRRRRSSGAARDLSPNVIPNDDLRIGEQSNDKSNQSIGKMSKNWIKKKLSFKESTKDQSPEHKSAVHSSKSKSRRAFLNRRKNNMLDRSTSEESVEDSEYKSRRKPTDKVKDKKEECAAKPRMKRYTRSKTDGNIEMKGLLSKFKVSQFGSKKPTVVKQFERKLLENEIRTIENDQETVKRTKNPLNVETNVREKVEDKGYSGEDEEEYIAVKSQGSLPRVGSTISLLENSARSPPKVLPKPKYHKSMVDLRTQDEFVLTNKEGHEAKSPVNLNIKSSKPRYEHIRTSLSNVEGVDKSSNSSDRNSTPERASVSNLVGKFSKNSKTFVRGGVGRHSLKQDERLPMRRNTEGAVRHRTIYEKPSQKRYSWSTPSPSSPNSIDERNTWREKVIGPSIEVGEKPRRKMSEDMLRKKSNLEKVLQAPAKPRRYRRSETQPIQSNRLVEDNEIQNEVGQFWDSNNQRNTSQVGNLSREEFTKNLSSDIVPELTSQFKKPTLANRRKPSRWKKE